MPSHRGSRSRRVAPGDGLADCPVVNVTLVDGPRDARPKCHAVHERLPDGLQEDDEQRVSGDPGDGTVEGDVGLNVTGRITLGRLEPAHDRRELLHLLRAGALGGTRRDLRLDDRAYLAQLRQRDVADPDHQVHRGMKLTQPGTCDARASTRDRLDQALLAENAQRLPEDVAGYSQHRGQLALGRQHLALAEPVVDDQLLDPRDDLLRRLRPGDRAVGRCAAGGRELRTSVSHVATVAHGADRAREA